MKTLFLVLLLLAAGVSPCHAFAEETSPLDLVVKTIQGVDNVSMQESLLRGVLKGLEGRRQVQAPKGWSTLKQSLGKSANPKVRQLSSELSQIFGDVQATEKALSLLRDMAAKTEDRRGALRSLLTQKNEEASDLLETLIDDPAMTLDAIRGYAMLENAAAPKTLLSRYASLVESEKQAVCETLATRKFYANALVDAVEGGVVPKDEIPIHVARSLKELLGEKYEATFGELRTLGDDREKLLAKYKAMLTPDTLAKANASKGRAVYKKTCANCHYLYDDGGDIGPELTGSNRANLDYILLNSVDPSYDVPEGYKTVVVATVDGRLVMGVVAEEDATKLVLKTVEEPRLVIAKADIEARKVSNKSMMPEGQLDQLKDQEVVDLIKYLQTTEQVEVAK